jgi:hypothetical protein
MAKPENYNYLNNGGLNKAKIGLKTPIFAQYSFKREGHL